MLAFSYIFFLIVFLIKEDNMYTIIMQYDSIGHHACLKENRNLFAFEFSLWEIFFVVYVHTLVCEFL